MKRVRQCAHCAAPIDETATRCWTCGQEVADLELPLGETTPAPNEPSRVEPSADMIALTVLPRKTEPGGQPPKAPVALIGSAAAIAGITAILILGWLHLQTPDQPVQAAPLASRPAAPPIVERAPAPTWVGRRQATWASDGSKTIAFELLATSDVPVWMSRVRPQLGVRCLYRSTEVFVAIHSAASIEGTGGSHTVRIQIDDDPELVQQWSDSVSGRELFAPNPVAFARRLARAEVMRFTFTPYNAAPVTADFSVTGFEDLARLVGKTCGWTIDAQPAAVRAAGLN